MTGEMWFLDDGDLRALIRGGLAAQGVVVQALLGGVPLDAKIKPDVTYVTQIDLAAEAAAMPFLTGTGLTVFSEEAGESGAPSGAMEREVILFDPLDGTRAFMQGAPTSTIIVATYSKDLKKVTRCVVADMLGRVWFATLGKGTWVFHHSGNLEQDLRSARQCRVWEGGLAPKNTVYVDYSPTFNLDGFPAVSFEAKLGFMAEVMKCTGVSLLGSNGLHHALVANGGHGVVGGVTKSKGGEWDVAPGLLVHEAGGHLRAFTTHGGSIRSADPLDVFSYNCLISGCSEVVTRHLLELATAMHRFDAPSS